MNYDWHFESNINYIDGSLSWLIVFSDYRIADGLKRYFNNSIFNNSRYYKMATNEHCITIESDEGIDCSDYLEKAIAGKIKAIKELELCYALSTDTKDIPAMEVI